MIGRPGAVGRALPFLLLLIAGITLAACGEPHASASRPLIVAPDTEPPTTAGPSPRSVTIAATGEILPHPSVVEVARRFGRASGRPFDFAPFFGDIEPLLSAADLAICHLEVVVAPPGTPLSGYPLFAIPADIGAGIRAGGWDRCSTASNHSNDRGAAGITATLDALDAAAVGHSGTARNEDEARTIPIVETAGARVAHLSYTSWFNGTRLAKPWLANVIDAARILSDAAAARASGAEIVVVSLHWGTEYGPPDRTQLRLTNQLLASPDVDLIVGHGPHVLQPIVQLHGKWALLSLGNLVSNQGYSKRPRTFDGAVVTVTFTEGPDGRFTATAPVAHPTWYHHASGRIRLVIPSLQDPSLASIHRALQVSLVHTTRTLGSHVAP